MTPAPKARVQKGQVVRNPDAAAVHAPEAHLIDLSEGRGIETIKIVSNGDSRSNSPAHLGTSPKTTFLRRSSSGADGNHIPVRGNVNDMREHLKHLGPSNLASRPKTTRYNTVKIKTASQPGRSDSRTDSTVQRDSIVEEPYRDDPAPFGGEGEGLLRSAGKDAKDGVQALQQGYGSFDPNAPSSPSKLAQSEQGYHDGTSDAKNSPPNGNSTSPKGMSFARNDTAHSESSDTIASLQSGERTTRRKKATTRSGSITENIIEAGGVRKVILETTSSSSDKEDGPSTKNTSKENLLRPPPGFNGQMDGADDHETPSGEAKGDEVKKKRRRTRHKKKGGKSSEEGSTVSGQ